jgi:hypothetical protein
MTTPPEQCMGALDFKIEWLPTTKTTETLHWTYQQSKFEIHVVLLEKVELNNIVTHCLGVLHKIDGPVGLDSKEQHVTSYLQVLPCTMCMPLQAYWKQVVQEFDETNEETIATLANFNTVLKTFFAGHSTDNNCHNLIKSLRSAIKPDAMKVQMFFYWLKKLNDYVDWLPGHEEKLTESQLNLAVYSGLPGSKYMIAGRSVHTDNCPELLCHFRVQEHQQSIIDGKNQILQAKARAKLEKICAFLS